MRDPYLTPPSSRWRFPLLSEAELAARFEGLTRDDLQKRAFHVVPVARLAQLCNPLACWVDQDDPITAAEVATCLNAGEEAQEETPLWMDIAFGKTTVTEAENRIRHIRKVAYFMRHAPQEPISVDVGCPTFGHFPDHIVDDGNHRLAGCILAGTAFIAAHVGGEVKEAKRLKLWNPTPEEQELCRRDRVRMKAQAEEKAPPPRPIRRRP